ncbi:MAG: pyruvate, phosphate dikinase [Lentisphaerae bacterium]|nr:pyruvate, phosphate dikinase [Lentisphaerota bacterium]
MVAKTGTKAEALARIRPLVTKSCVLDLAYFSVAEYRANPTAIETRIGTQFGPIPLAVRSSAQSEDSLRQSMAGVFKSVLGVDGADAQALRSAIERVIASYAGSPDDQVLIQPMLSNIAVSGVIMSSELDHGAPYYVINYDDESGRTDSITGGTGVNKTVLVFRHCNDTFMDSERIRRFVGMAREIETLYGSNCLDIEFAMDHGGQLYLLQVRPISVSSRWPAGVEQKIRNSLQYIETFVRDRSNCRRGLLGRRTILGEMPDWNPAEMIGTTPRPLAASLYRELITKSTWRLARERMGYRRLASEELMVMIGGRPFIDVRNSFNSFLPDGLDDEVGEILINAWIDRLDTNPQLHDKVEFEVAHTCLDFVFDTCFAARYPQVLSPEACAHFKERLLDLTRRNVNIGANASLAEALRDVDLLAEEQRRRDLRWANLPDSLDILTQVHDLLDRCTQLGTLPFSVIARHAFIAEALLRSAIAREALSAERVQEFKRSVHTITNDMMRDMRAVCRGRSDLTTFMKRYGHLRPGTYEIMSLRYADRPDLFNQSFLPDGEDEQSEFNLSAPEQQRVNQLLHEARLSHLDGESLLAYAGKAIAGREYAKFVFTRNLSDALEGLAEWGARQGLDREDVSYISLSSILDTTTVPVLDESGSHFKAIVERGRHGVAVASALKLSYIIRGVRDVYVVPLHRSAPNFIGSGRVEGPVVRLDAGTPATVNLTDRIACIENADPGYDWVFTKGIKGLITKFGGANSHMAIRCAEFGLPAAIGCGEQTFERLVAAGAVEINGGNKILRPLCSSGD